MEVSPITRETRVVNRSFSLAEYGSGWTKLERYLFIELYNVIKDFYIAKNDRLIKDFNSENIIVKLPIESLDKNLFGVKNRSQQIIDTHKTLSKKQINYINVDASGQMGFGFINMFTYIIYDPSKDKKHIEFKIPKEIYSEMIPIESYCLLDLKLLSAFNSGNTIRLYEVFKSYAFKTQFTITFNDLRKNLGFYDEDKYGEWKYFNSQVLKKAVLEINKHKEFDIEVFYKKARGSENIEFQIIQHNKDKPIQTIILSLNQMIDPNKREFNMIQSKYIKTLIRNCDPEGLISNVNELTDWIISDLIIQQEKYDDEYDFKKSANAISKQIREGVYTQPYAHKHLT